MTNIEWTDDTWNPIVGCSVVSPGCTNCYAMKMAARLEAMRIEHYRGLTWPSKAGAVWTSKIARAPEHILTKPLRWKNPRKIFVNSMGDLFHESVPDEWIDCVFAVMALCPRHIFQVPSAEEEMLSRQEPAAWVWTTKANSTRAVAEPIAAAMPPCGRTAIKPLPGKPTPGSGRSAFTLSNGTMCHHHHQRPA